MTVPTSQQGISAGLTAMPGQMAILHSFAVTGPESQLAGNVLQLRHGPCVTPEDAERRRAIDASGASDRAARLCDRLAGSVATGRSAKVA
jgi:hypothetical protein